MLGVPAAAQPPYEVAIAMYPSGYREDVQAAVDECATNGTPIDMESVIADAHGRQFPVRIVGEAVRDDADEIIGLRGAFLDISAIVAAREQQLEAEGRWRSTLDKVLDPVVLIDRDWRVSFANSTAVEFSGLSIEELTSRTIWELFPEITSNDFRSVYEGAMSAGTVGSAREYMAQIDRWLEVAAHPFESGIAAVFRDVTADERAKSALREQARRLSSYERMLTQASDAIMALDLEGRITYWNDAAARLYGLSESEAMGRVWFDLIEPAVGEAQSLALRHTLLDALPTRGSGFDHDLHLARTGEITRELECRWSLIGLDSSSDVLGDTAAHANAHAPDSVILGVHADVTERNIARREFEKIESRLSETLDEIQDALFFFDREWRFTFANETGEQFIQNPKSRLLGSVLWDLYPEAYDSTFGEVYRRTMDHRVVSTNRDYYAPLDTWFEATAYPIEEGVAVILRDVTDDQKRREELDQVRREAVQQAALLEAARDAMIVLDLDGTIRYWNTGATQLYGRGRSDAKGLPLQVLFSSGDALDTAFAVVREHGYWQGELRHRTPSGRIVVADCRWQVLRDAEGTATGIFAVHSDVTELRARQEASIRDQRIESLGTLAGGMAHDLNNVLTPLLMSVQLLRSRELEADVTDLLETMEIGIRRGADMIRQVLTFARGSDTAHDVVLLGTVIEEIEQVGLVALPKTIDISLDVPDGLAVVGDGTQISQVLLNLVTNARDAMRMGGMLTVHAETVDIADKADALSLLNPGRYVRVSVEDTGQGMDDATLDKIFEPFFTTKPLGEGTGLGLSTSRAIVRSHGGRLTAYSEPGRGTRFDLYLRAADPHSDVLEVPATRTEPDKANGQLVLVVDDESSVRQLVCQTLESFGYRTLQASNGREAIETLTEVDGRVDLVFTDMMMPVMDGAATAAYLAEHHPHIPVVAASGLNANGGVARAAGVGVHRFIAKPFTTETLLRTVADALASVPES